MVIHVVQPGDSLYRIAREHQVPLPLLIAQNELREPYRLTPGQTVVVPQPTQTHTVRQGETLTGIAAQYNTTAVSYTHLDVYKRQELESKLGGRKVALFGSYGWGDGQWMRDWVERTDNANANIYTGEGLMAHETPDETMLEQCRDFGRGFAAY